MISNNSSVLSCDLRRTTFYILFAFAVAGWGQAYYEASGQTQVFTLTAGAKAGSAAIKRSPALLAAPKNGICVKAFRGGFLVTLLGLQRGYADIVLYDIKGRQVCRRRAINCTSLRLETGSFAPGIYTLFVHAWGQSFSRRIAVNGRRE
jgi:hypothetical protein